MEAQFSAFQTYHQGDRYLFMISLSASSVAAEEHICFFHVLLTSFGVTQEAQNLQFLLKLYFLTKTRPIGVKFCTSCFFTNANLHTKNYQNLRD